MFHVSLMFSGGNRINDVYTSGPHATAGIVLDALLAQDQLREDERDLVGITINPNSDGPPAYGTVVEQVTP